MQQVCRKARHRRSTCLFLDDIFIPRLGFQALDPLLLLLRLGDVRHLLLGQPAGEEEGEFVVRAGDTVVVPSNTKHKRANPSQTHNIG